MGADLYQFDYCPRVARCVFVMRLIYIAVISTLACLVAMTLIDMCFQSMEWSSMSTVSQPDPPIQRVIRRVGRNILADELVGAE